MTSGKLNPAALVTHIGGLDCVVDTTLNLPKIRGGKMLIYTQIEMPLVAIDDFAKLGETPRLPLKLFLKVKYSRGRIVNSSCFAIVCSFVK
ncbi:MAG: hypothetical protein J6A26_01900, partial [Oscillospiraceae bacterium]|nr:hypothetical protein [Oscillospiraceae bacterium]